MVSSSCENNPDTRDVAMEGGGFYNRHSAMQAAGIAALLPLWENLVDQVTLGDGPVVISDYGCSQGHNSMLPIRLALEGIRSRTEPRIPIEVVHTDLPSNDYSELFWAIELDPDSYLQGAENVFPSAVGRSYFQQILPSGRVHLGWNSWTLQWLSTSEIHAPDQVFAALTQSKEVVDRLRSHQASDWRRFLEARAAELRNGGGLLSAFPAFQDGKTGWEWLAGEFWGAMRDLGDEGFLSESERIRLTVPTAPRSAEQIRDPFSADGFYAGLRLERLEIVQIADPIWEKYRAKGDAAALAMSHANMARAFSGPTVADVLNSRDDGTYVTDKIYSRLAERLAQAPQAHKPYLAVVVLRKIG